jgi:hypothetical protein
VDGIVRGIAKNVNPALVSGMKHVEGSATKDAKGSFGSGNFPEGKMGGK